MKNYSKISEQYRISNGLKRVYIRSTVGVMEPYFLTEKEIAAFRQRGVAVHNSDK